MKKSKSTHDEVSRLSLPMRSKVAMEADKDSDLDDDEDTNLSVLVNSLQKILNKSQESSLGDYLSLPKDLQGIKLSSKLESGVNENDLYHQTEGDLLVTNSKTARREQEEFSGAALADHKLPMGKKKLKKLKKIEREKTKGKDWYNMSAPEMTEERQRDLELLQMRHVLDPKRFYKKNNSENLPKYFQIGTVVDNAADFYTDRVAKKDRKQTMVDELLADAEFKKYQKRKYVEIIEDKSKKQGKFYHKKKKGKV